MNIQNSLLRLQKIGLTQSQLGEELGFEQSTISDYLNGKLGKKPTYKIVSGIQKAEKKYAKQLKQLLDQSEPSN